MNNVFKKLTVVSVVGMALGMGGCASKPQHFCSVGAGYKIDEMELRWADGSPVGSGNPTARIECWQQREFIKYGIAHHSQWFTGAPFNDRNEYHKTEVFVDVIFDLNFED